MRKILYALAGVIALLCLAPAAQAQQYTVPFTGRSPFTATQSLVSGGETISVPLNGAQWATAQWVVKTAGSGGITTEYTIDGGVNWLASAYSKRLDQVTANPSVAPWANNTPVAGTYETPLPGNCTAFRIRYQTGGTSTVITLSGGAPYVPGVPVVATLQDVTVAFAVAVPSATFDLSGWSSAEYELSNQDTGGVSRSPFVAEVLADGVANAGYAATVNSGQRYKVFFGVGPAASAALGGGADQANFFPWTPPRVLTSCTAGTGTGGATRSLFRVRR